MQANLGGTELLRPLQWLEEHLSAEGRARQIFLLTDGQISNVDQVLDLCRSMVTSTRIFSFGLGRSLVKGLARAINGHFVFISPDTNVDIYIVKWNLGRNVVNIPTKTPLVYINDRLIVYALADDDNQSNSFEHNSPVELCNDKHRLAAKALILELQHSKLPSSNKKNGSLQARFEQQVEEENKERKKRIIELSLKYNILCPYTAFIGIEKRVNRNNNDMVLREVTIQISADDQQL